MIYYDYRKDKEAIASLEILTIPGKELSTLTNSFTVHKICINWNQKTMRELSQEEFKFLLKNYKTGVLKKTTCFNNIKVRAISNNSICYYSPSEIIEVTTKLKKFPKTNNK